MGDVRAEGNYRARHSAWVASILFVGAMATAPALAAPKTHSVTIEGTRYAPERLTVHQGDHVVWTNKDPFPHTVTGRSGGFDSRSIAPNASWRYVADKTGTFPYVCTFHPMMKGTLVVE